MKHHSQGKVLRKQELKGNRSGMKHKMHRTGGDEPAVAGGGGVPRSQVRPRATRCPAGFPDRPPGPAFPGGGRGRGAGF